MAWEGPSRLFAWDEILHWKLSPDPCLLLPSGACTRPEGCEMPLSYLVQAQLSQEQDLLEFSAAGQQNCSTFSEKQFTEVFGLLPKLSCKVNAARLQGRF